MALIKSIFDAEEIKYFVRNEVFGTLISIPPIAQYNAKAVLVDEADYERAGELLADFLNRIHGA